MTMTDTLFFFRRDFSHGWDSVNNLGLLGVVGKTRCSRMQSDVDDEAGPEADAVGRSRTRSDAVGRGRTGS